MMNLKDKMLVTKVLLVFSCLIASSGIGVFAGGLWLFFRFKGTGAFAFAFCILIICLFLAAMVRMFANIGQILFDLRSDFQRVSKDSSELEQKLNQELLNQLELQANSLNQNIQANSNTLIHKLELQANSLVKELQAVISTLQQGSHDSSELEQKLNQELLNQLELQANSLNQNIQANSNTLNHKLQNQIDILNRELRAIIGRFQESLSAVNELSKKFSAVRDSFGQMNCDSKDMNKNIRQIKDFFERIERHLDLKK